MTVCVVEGGLAGDASSGRGALTLRCCSRPAYLPPQADRHMRAFAERQLRTDFQASSRGLFCGLPCGLLGMQGPAGAGHVNAGGKGFGLPCRVQPAVPPPSCRPAGRRPGSRGSWSLRAEAVGLD